MSAVGGVARNTKFGITKDKFYELLEYQGNVCSICGTDKPVKFKNKKRDSWAIDHDHKTGKIRGILCYYCNVALSYLEEDGFVEAAQEYLNNPPASDILYGGGVEEDVKYGSKSVSENLVRWSSSKWRGSK